MRLFLVAATLCLATGSYAQTQFPGNPLTVNAISAAGTSFTYSGVLTGNTLLSLSAGGAPCIQGTGDCTNPAGVVVVAGSGPVGADYAFNGVLGGVNSSWTVGSLLMTISGVGTVPVFAPTIANGLNSPSPPSSLSLSGTTLSSLGFGTFSVTNPTVTFFLADNEYQDNTGSFTVSGSFTGSGTPAAPTLSPAASVLLALLLIAMAVVIMRRQSGLRTN